MRKIVYVREGCSGCKNMIKELQEKGEEVEVRDAKKLLDGEREDHHDVEAMAELQMNDLVVPVVVQA